MLSPYSPILWEPRTTQARCAWYILMRPHGEYLPHDIAGVIVPGYFAVCRSVGVDPLVAIAQMCLETGSLSSALSQRRDKDGRPLRNPAGIGVTEESSTKPRPGLVWDADRLLYRACVQFADWYTESIPAHVGRLVAWATRPAERTKAQQALVDRALKFRPLTVALHGMARTPRALGGGTPIAPRWAVDVDYGNKIARIANEILEAR